jgi:hypothetical protein
MSVSCEVPPTVLSGSDVALFVCGLEVPIEKCEVKKHAKKTETTSSVSVWGGQLWDEFAPGASGGTVSWDSKWHVSQQIVPPAIRQGAIYPIAPYVRRPFTNGASDPGSAFSMNLLIEDNTITLDPKSGVIDWKAGGTVTGPIVDPT